METLELKIEAFRLKESGLLHDVHPASSKDSPIYLNVDTGIDYGAIVTAVIGFVVAVIVARFTVGVQRNQIKANISNFRHQWMVDLRECASELIQLMALMISTAAKQKGYKPSDEYVKHYARALQLRSKIELLLSRDDDYTVTIRSACGDLLGKISKIKVDDEIDPLIEAMVAFQDLLRKELERAWGHTKNDLGINTKVLGIRYFNKTHSRDL
ncbi:hypothetical protein ACIOAU_15895 [Pseudomonas sp. NPDC088322]|uniref:hypothetical protein n=1 Tax=Pseudomonas sp. NPDC088322 TaxID=3364452 RepID=UPI00381D40F5